MRSTVHSLDIFSTLTTHVLLIPLISTSRHMASSNIAVFTKSHSIVAAKKKAKKEQLKEIVFDDAARRQVARSLNNFPFNVSYRDFLTGFHKRKLQKKEEAKKKAKEREKQERLEARREVRPYVRACQAYVHGWTPLSAPATAS